MRTYESIFIVHPDVVGDEQIEVIDKYKKILSDQGAEVLKVENWGVRTLAYMVKKQSRGCYVLFIFEAEPTVIAEFERRMRIDDKVIKFQTITMEGGYEAPVVEETVEETAETSADETTVEAAEAPAEAPAEAKVEAKVEEKAEEK